MKIQKLTPHIKDYIWGGEKLITKYGKASESGSAAESWELSFHKDGLSLLENGESLAGAATDAELGENLSRFKDFPVLIKLIDAKNDLSIQVHPSDDYALKYENSYGKTEMWYIVEAEEGAGIYLGFNKDVTTAEVENAIKNNTICELLNFYKVKAGECYFIPSGTIHAICKGCLILEIQQSSNLTYRVYDYDRKDKNGVKRELHVEKAIKVVDTNKFTVRKMRGDLLGASRYFTVRRYAVTDKTFVTDGKTFNAITCTRGNGLIDGKAMKAGDTFFVPSDHGKYRITGDAEIVLTEVRRYFVGVDVGGTFVKLGIVDDKGDLVAFRSIETRAREGAENVAKRIADAVNELLKSVNFTKNDVEGMGVGIPGLIDGNGKVLFSNNLKWRRFDLSGRLEEYVGIKVRAANDADAAALGECRFGAGKDVDDCVTITLGTGIGSGVVTGGRLYRGNASVGCEIGHSFIVRGGEKCNCGRSGCFEAYASATALIRATVRAMKEHPESAMNEVAFDKVNGKTAFDYYATDPTAKSVIDEYLGYLSCGIVNVSNAYRPQKIVIGGGLCKQKIVIKTLQKAVNERSFGGRSSPKCKVVAAKNGNDAGILGAASLWMDRVR